MSIAENIAHIKTQLPQSIKLICVSKFHPAEDILAAYNCGERRFGESHAQELVEKQQMLPKDIEWHFIGSLQTNKVKMVVPIATLIHSVDTERLLAVIDKCAMSNNLISNVLLEVHVAQEATKHGFSADELRTFFANQTYARYAHVHICGLMAMGTATDDAEQTRHEFHQMNELFNELKAKYALPYFTELSMGMSEDYPIAVTEGSTMVRIGTSIFGERNY